MRVLVAADGSAPAEVAQRLARSLDWPDGTTIRVVTAIQWPLAMYALPLAPAPAMPADLERLDSDLTAHGESVLEEAARALARDGVNVDRRLVRGRAATAIVDEALAWKADVVVLGSRGHGAIGSMLLGSVSAEVVDHAPCPVIVARRESLTRTVLGHDGSEFASAAEQIVATWPIFRRVPVDVVSVAHVGAPWHSGLAPTMYAEALEAYAESTREATRQHDEIARASARRLSDAGLHAAPVAPSGEPAATLVAVADERRADMIVVGTHGRTGVTRALLGSVARNVLQHADCSVMVVRAAPRPLAGPEGGAGLT